MEEETLSVVCNSRNVDFVLDLSYWHHNKRWKSVTIPAESLKGVQKISFSFCHGLSTRYPTCWEPEQDFDTADFIETLPETLCLYHKIPVALILRCDTWSDAIEIETQTITEPERPCHLDDCQYCNHKYLCKCQFCSGVKAHPCNTLHQYTKRTATRVFRYSGITQEDQGDGSLQSSLIKLDEDAYNLLKQQKGSLYRCCGPSYMGENDSVTVPLRTLTQRHIIDDGYFKTRERWSTPKGVAQCA